MDSPILPLPAAKPALIRLLLVEDDEVDRLSFQRHVLREQLPYAVTVATSLAEGRRALAEATFDLVLLDCHLGDGSGFQLLEVAKDSCVIFVTGADSPETAVQAMKLGASDYLLKDLEGRYLALLPTAVTRALQHRLEERERAKLQALLQQAQKLEALGTLAGGMAHEFNNILAIIISYLELARLDATQCPAVRPHLDEIFKASQRARDIIQQILLFNHSREAPRQVIRLESVIRAALDLLRPGLPATVNLRVNSLSPATRIEANFGHVQQALVNVCKNAWQSLPGFAGNVELREAEVTLSEPTADHPKLAPGRYVRLTVTDNGIGMDAATLARVFDPFFSAKPAGQGTGLGMSVVHGIMQAHGGAVILESQPGLGTSAHLYFPAVTVPEAGNVQVPDSRVPAVCGKRILLIDDEPALVRVCSKLLERMGHVPLGHTHPLEAIARLQLDPQSVDLVITDFNMPGLNGLATAEAIVKLDPGLPIILATGFGEEGGTKLARQIGIVSVLPKPISPHSLAEAVKFAR